MINFLENENGQEKSHPVSMVWRLVLYAMIRCHILRAYVMSYVSISLHKMIGIKYWILARGKRDVLNCLKVEDSGQRKEGCALLFLVFQIIHDSSYLFHSYFEEFYMMNRRQRKPCCHICIHYFKERKKKN